MGIRSKCRKLICCSQHTNAIIFNVILQVSLSLGNCLVQSSWCSACGRFTCSLQKKSKKFVMRIDNDLLFKAQTNIRQFKRQTRENKHKTRAKDPKFVFRVLVIYDGAHKTTSNLSAHNHRVDGGRGAWRILCWKNIEAMPSLLLVSFQH